MTMDDSCYEYSVECEIARDGTKCWYNKHGVLHREDGPALENANGDKRWFINGELHREDGPANEWIDGDTSWYKHGKLHREDGPAVEWSGGNKLWFLNNNQYSLDEYCIKLYGSLEHPKSIMLQVKYG